MPLTLVLENNQILKKAFELARHVHGKKVRSSGELFLSHTLGTAEIIHEWGFNEKYVAAAILHDVLDHENVENKISMQDLKNAVGTEVSVIVDAMKTLEDIQESTKNKRTYQELMKVLTFEKDPRAILLKLASGLEHLRNLRSIRDEGVLKNKTELFTLIFSPLSARLGIWDFKRELEDTCLSILFTETFDLIRNWKDNLLEKNNQFTKRTISNLEMVCGEAGIHAKVSWHQHHIYSLYQSLLTKPTGLTSSAISNHISYSQVIWFQITTSCISDCYRALQAIHEFGQPIQKSISDYIASPKPNGYSAIHSTILCKDEGTGIRKLDIKIMTEDMGNVAGRGVSDPRVFNYWFEYWKFRNTSEVTQDVPKEKYILNMVQSLCIKEPSKLSQVDRNEGIRYGKSNSGQIKVFTPEGKMILLRNGSVPIDFAYYIHSEMGNQFERATVNGKDVPIEYTLRDGDVVQIHTSSKASPKETWLEYVATQTAEYRIKKWLREAPRSRGYSVLLQAIAQKGYTWNDINTQARVENVARELFGSLENMLDELGTYRIPVNLIVEQVTGEVKSSYHPMRIRLNDNILKARELHVRTALCCRPTYPAPIIGLLSGKQLTIHHASCGNAFKSKRRVNISWESSTIETIKLGLKIEGYDRLGLLREISEVIGNQSINIDSVHAKREPNQRFSIDITLDLNSDVVSEHLFNDLRKIDGVIDVKVTENAGGSLKSLVRPLVKEGRNQHLNEGSIPYYPGRPVTGDHRFYGREQELKKIRGYFLAKDQPTSFSLIAQKRSGKTSLALQMINHQSIKRRYLPVYIDLQQKRGSSDDEVLKFIAKKVWRNVPEEANCPRPLSTLNLRDDIYGRFEEEMSNISQALNREIIIILDEFDALIQAHLRGVLSERFFLALRQWASHSPMRFFIIRTHYYHKEINNVLPFYEDVSMIDRLDPLDELSAKKLIVEPAEQSLYYTNDALTKIMNVTARYPFFIQHLCWIIADQALKNHRSEINTMDVENAILELTRPIKEGYFSHFWRKDSAAEQLALYALAHAQTDQNGWVTIEAVWAKIHDNQFDLAGAALKELTLLETIEAKTEQGIMLYRICLPLLILWVKNSLNPDELIQRIEI